MATIDELMKEKIPGEIRIRRPDWKSFRFFRPYFKDYQSRWHGTGYINYSLVYIGEDDWEEFEGK